MPLDLAALAVEAGAISAEDMERALARQREEGGALDTALLELGLVAEPELVRLLSRASGLPPAPIGRIRSDAPARNLFPARVAERHRLVPFRLEGRQLSLVAAHPVDMAAVDEISFMLSLHLVVHVAPEWRVAEAMAPAYGFPIPPRLAAIAARDPTPLAPAWRLGRVDPEEPLATAVARAAGAFDATELLRDVIAPPPVPDEPPGWSLREASGALDAARDRDDVLAVALRYARDFVEAAAVLAVTRDGVVGLDAVGWPGARARCRAVHVAQDRVALLRAVVETRGPYLGPISPDPGNEELLRELGRPWPAIALAYPVVLRERVVCVLYADNGAAPVSARRVGDLLLLAGALGPALERVVRAAKVARHSAPRAEAKDEGGWAVSEPAQASIPAPPPPAEDDAFRAVSASDALASIERSG